MTTRPTTRTLALILTALALLTLLITASGRGAQDDAQPRQPRFERRTPALHFDAYDVYIDTGAEELGAYQVELQAFEGVVRLTGVEGGDHAAFRAQPFYDPEALLTGRVIIGDFSVEPSLPVGLNRVATIRVQAGGPGEVEWSTSGLVAGDREGDPIEADVVVRRREEHRR